MMKKLLNIFSCLPFVILVGAVACNSNGGNATNRDTSNPQSVVDSMPVVKPPVTDSSAIFKTPPVNDNNVIMPDSFRKNK